MAIIVVVAETSPSVRSILEITLCRPGYDLHFTASGQEFLSSLNEKEPDVALINPNFSDADGLEMARFMRIQESTRAIPIVLLLGAFDRIDEEKVAQLACEETIRQPFDSVRLKSIIRSLAEEKNLPQSLPEEPVLEDSLSSLTKEQIQLLVKEEIALIRDEILGKVEKDEDSVDREVEREKGPRVTEK
ncbi:PleD family two-component system response regulator [Acidobacteriota bacterium]